MKCYSSLRNVAFLLVLVITEFTGLISSDNDLAEPDLQDIGDQIASHLPTDLPPLPINMSHLPSEEEATKRLKEKCEKMGGPGAYDRVKNEGKSLLECAQNLANVTQLQEEIEEAKPTGDLDAVFRKYCQKRPILTNCVSNFSYAVDFCLEEKEKESKEIVQNITEALLEFLCYKEGDRIALFIAEGGVECIQSKRADIEECANKTVGTSVQQEMGNLQEIPLLAFSDSTCSSFEDLQKCVVNSLEKCDEPTPANIVESLFAFIEKMLPCQRLVRNGAEATVYHSSLLVAFSLGLVMLSSF